MNKLYLILVFILFASFAVVFNTFSRPTFSELEKRELATFPEFSFESLADGSFTSNVSSWFSDSEPFRDTFMHLSMNVKKAMHLSTGDDDITFHASADGSSSGGFAIGDEEEEEVDIEKEMALAAAEAEDTSKVFVPADENAKIANNGILIIGQGENVRALMAYGGSGKGCVGYAESAYKYKEMFPNVTRPPM